jgi:hypothetical protein
MRNKLDDVSYTAALQSIKFTAQDDVRSATVIERNATFALTITSSYYELGAKDFRSRFHSNREKCLLRGLDSGAGEVTEFYAI